jgi:tRNA/rRNA methyltransferase
MSLSKGDILDYINTFAIILFIILIGNALKVNLNNISIILNEPRVPENIGAAARCCQNMGIPELICVNPRTLDMENMFKMATHEARHLIENMPVYKELREAIAPFNYVVGTTARTGRFRIPTDTPRDIAQRLIPISQNNRIAFIFGSEKWGLSNEDLRLCQSVVAIPTAAFSSINLAQSVMIICYELLAANGEYEVFQPKTATIFELEGMYRHLKDALSAIGFIREDNPDYWMSNVRSFFSRLELRSREVRLIRGFCRQLLWALKKTEKNHP